MTLIKLGDESNPLAQAVGGVTLNLNPDLTQDEWIDVGVNLGRASQGIQWYLGDWLNYGVQRGFIESEKYDLAEEITKMSRAWLQVCAWVSRAIKPEDRRPDLSFEHHKRIASIKPGPERSVLLQVAAETKMSARDLYNLAGEVLTETPILSTPPPSTSRIFNYGAQAVNTTGVTGSVQTPDYNIPIGEVIELGPHRLIVGDSTDPSTYDLLFAGQPQASVIWTDPPYGVSYEGKTQDELRIQNDRPADLPELLNQAFGLSDQYLRDGSAIYSCCGFANMHLFVQAATAVGWRFSVELIWVKNMLAIGWGDYHPKHESMIYCFKGQSHRWYGPRDRSTVFGLSGPGQPLEYTIPMPNSNIDHPTMKPPRLIFEQLRNSALSEEVVLDPFAGSGSTMVAAEALGLRAFMIELEPKYAAAIIKRYESEVLNAASSK